MNRTEHQREPTNVNRARFEWSDIYSLGMVLYQLLVGDFHQPLVTDWASRVRDRKST